MEYAPGILMLGTDNGLVNFNTKDRSFEPLDSGTTGRNGRLNDKFIHSILKDREGGVWIGTYFGGINYLSPLSSLFTTIGPGAGCGRIISKFCEGPDGKIWIGSDDGGLSLFDPRTGSYTPVAVDPRRPGLNIHALTLDNDCLWIGTYGDGLYRMDLRSGAVRHFDQSAGSSDKLDTYSVFRDSRGSLWVGTKQGICRYDDAREQIVLVAELGHNSDVVDICEDGLGNVWFASQGRGLIRYRYDTDDFTNLARERKPELSDFVSSLAVENDRLWIGTLGSGLCRYDIRRDSLVRSFDDTAYGNCAVYQVIQSGSDLWLTTNKGVLKYSPAAERMQINKYTAEDGLLANIFNAGSGIKASTGHIYIGCNNGVNRFYPYDFVRRENSTKLGIVFPDFKLFNLSVPVDGELLTETIDCQRKITVRGRRISFSIDFIALNFSSPLRTTYRYRLENFDEQWLTTQLDESSGVQHVSYTNLPPNRYRFVVSAAAGAELPGEPAVLEITVLPPWWMTRTMLGVYALLCMLGVAGSGHYLRRRLGRVHNEQIASITRKNKLDLLEAKVNLFTEVAAEIRTPVSLISAPAEQIAACAELPGSVRKDVAIIRKNCDRLLHLVNQILGLRNSEKTTAPVIEYGIDACELLASAVAEIRNGCPRPDIELDLHLPKTTFRVDICPDHLIRMVSNVVDNAFRFAENRIDVVLEAPVAEGDNSIFVIRIRDDGAGIRNEDRERIFNLFYTSDTDTKGSGKRLGLGLTIVRNLALKMGAEVTVRSQVGRWTEFAMKFPVAAPGGGAEPEQTVECQTVCPDASKSREVSSGCRPVVMLVEQHADFADFFVRHLSGRFTIICVAEAVEALELLHTRPVAAVVCETELAGMDGIAFCVAVKRDRALDHIPLVLVSVDESAGGKVRGLQAGADVYLEKPVSVGVLEAQILSLVENRAGLRAKYSKMPYFQLDEPAAKSSGNRFMSEVNQYLMDNISNSALTVDDVAAALNVGRTVFFNRIKSLTGMTPNEFLRSVRLRSAAELLAAPNNLRVTEICYMVGFASASYFAKCFAAQFGMLPTEYLEKYRKG